MILAQVINEFLEINGDTIDLVKISKIKDSRIIKDVSSYFIGTLKKVEYITEKIFPNYRYIINLSSI